MGGGIGDEVQAVCVFGYTPYVAEYLFGVSAPEGRRHSAALLWHGAMRLRSLGIPRLNLGGGIHRGDGVADFKRRFGAARRALGSLRQVYDPERFEELCRRAGVDPSDRAGYFPPYRGP